ncbi:MAG TPA: hypothetical protein VM577_07585 [Anaerovoracaceae bacterium]|nr:hypothetical protein [Anaerovoracaceae bacterium]
MSEWVLYIEYYLQQARMHLTTQTGELQGLDDMRKIAAMAVCCMEENGIVERGSFPSARS